MNWGSIFNSVKVLNFDRVLFEKYYSSVVLGVILFPSLGA